LSGYLPLGLGPSSAGLGTGRGRFLSVNGGAAVEVPVTGTSWVTAASTVTTVTLNAGNNPIKVFNNTAFAPDLDRLT
jgi:hypothetical protein